MGQGYTLSFWGTLGRVVEPSPVQLTAFFCRRDERRTLKKPPVPSPLWYLLVSIKEVVTLLSQRRETTPGEP